MLDALRVVREDQSQGLLGQTRVVNQPLRPKVVARAGESARLRGPARTATESCVAPNLQEPLAELGQVMAYVRAGANHVQHLLERLALVAGLRALHVIPTYDQLRQPVNQRR